MGLAGALGVILTAVVACQRTDPQPASPPPEPVAVTSPSTNAVTPRESLEAQEVRLDSSVWREEVLAVQHEATFVALRDALRQATNKIEVLAAFDFGEISLPAPSGEAKSFDLGIQEQTFEDRKRGLLPARGWAETLLALETSGWTLQQGAWDHERFEPGTNGHPAVSQFSFHLHGQRPPATRFILQGTLTAIWSPMPGSNGLYRPQRLLASNVTVLDRAGLPGFARTAVVTPNAPESRGDMISLHPVVVTDLDQDDDNDLVLGGANQLFLNPGDARFKVMEFVSESVFQGSRSAGVVADFNQDGWLDFLTVGAKGTYTNQLTLYAGSGSYPFSTAPSIAAEGLRLLAPSVLTAGDIDGDGDLDAFIAQYKPPGVGGQMPTPYWDAMDGYPAYLLINDSHGHFTVAAGNTALYKKRLRRTFAASFIDLDGDRDLDLVTVNDFAGLDVYYNDGTGKFSDETARLYNPHLFGMGITFRDFDADGKLDFLATGMNLSTVQRLDGLGLIRADQMERSRWRTEMSYGNRVYVAKEGQWSQPAFSGQLGRTGWAWGVSAGDLDNDGDLEIFCANGNISGSSVADYDSHNWRHDMYVANSAENRDVARYFGRTFQDLNTGRISWMGHQHNVLFMDVGSNHYQDVAWLMDVAHEQDSRAVVFADLNNDGRLDLLATEAEWMSGPSTGRNRLHLHLNQLRTSGHWIGARLYRSKRGTSPIGAEVTVEAGGRRIPAQLVTGDSFQSQHPSQVHFGLGPIREVERLTVRWSDGEQQVLVRPQVDAYHNLGAARKAAP